MGREDEIRLIAHSIWEDEGCPDGRDREHWLRAETIWEEQAPKAAAKSAMFGRHDSIDGESPQSSIETEPCARCRGKGVIVCPVCQGTGEMRNTSYLIVDRCHNCEKGTRGFITCPNCLGRKVVSAERWREMRKLEAEHVRSSPAVWGFTIPTPPRRISVDVPRTIS
jgi:hypothetical protein